MLAGNYDLEIREEEGYPLLAPKSYWGAAKEYIDANTGGCGPGKLGDYFVPDNLLGESVFLACRIHDWMYFVGKTKEDKDIADRVFLWNMLVLVNDGEFLDHKRLDMAMLYYEAVSFHGGSSFEK